MKVTLRVLYEPDPANLKPIYRQYGMYYAETVLPNIGNEILKAVVVRGLFFIFLLIKANIDLA